VTDRTGDLEAPPRPDDEGTMPPGPPDTDLPGKDPPERYLEVLHADYAALRSDQQGLNVLITGLFSLGVVIFGPIGYFLVASCHVATLSCDASIWPPVMALVPLGPLGIIGFFGVLSNVNIVRSYYIRAVEHELQRVAGSPEVSFRGGDPIRLPSFVEITETMVSQRRGLLHYRLLNMLSVMTLGLLFTGTTVFCLLYARPIDLQVAAGLFYTGIIVLLGLTVWDATKGGPGLWRYATKHVHRVNDADVADATRPRRGRRFVSYLLLPRPGDLLFKGWIIPIAWILAAAGTAGLRWSSWWNLVAFTVVFELVFYQGRYIVNDLRGLGVDATYSAFKRSTRFPDAAGRREIWAAIVVVIVRVSVTVWFALRVLTPPFQEILLVAMLAVLVQAVVYETLRELVSCRPGRNLLAMTPGRVAVLVVVGTGYAIRACVGLSLARAGAEDWLMLGLAAVMMTALGSLFVTMTWTLDGIIQVALRPGEDLPTHRYRSALETACHIAPLLGQARLLGYRDDGLERTAAHSPARDRSNPLNRRRSLELISDVTWWNAMLLVAAPLAAMAGVRIAGDLRVAPLLLAGAVGAMTGAAVLGLYGGDERRWLRLPGLETPRWGRGLAALAAGAALVALLSAGAGPRGAFLAWSTLALVGLVYLFFRHATRATVLFDPGIVLDAVRRVLLRLLRRGALIVLGPEAARRLSTPGHAGPARAPAGAEIGPARRRRDRGPAAAGAIETGRSVNRDGHELTVTHATGSVASADPEPLVRG
jgi:hypothetical protein